MSRYETSIVFGEVPPDSEHFALIYGTVDDEPVEIARLGATLEKPILELAFDLPPELRARAFAEAKRAVCVDFESSTIIACIKEDGGSVCDWTWSLRYRSGSVSNLYGDLHWSYRDGKTG